MPERSPNLLPGETMELCEHGNYKPCLVCAEDERRKREVPHHPSSKQKIPPVVKQPGLLQQLRDILKRSEK